MRIDVLLTLSGEHILFMDNLCRLLEINIENWTGGWPMLCQVHSAVYRPFAEKLNSFCKTLDQGLGSALFEPQDHLHGYIVKVLLCLHKINDVGLRRQTKQSLFFLREMNGNIHKLNPTSLFYMVL